MTSEGEGAGSSRASSSVPLVPSAALDRLADLDRRIVPVVAMRLDRLLPARRGERPRRPPLGVVERRILAALAVLLLVSALGLALIGS